MSNREALIASGDYWIFAVDTVVDGWFAPINEEDGYPDLIYATEADARDGLVQEERDDEYFIVHASDYLHFRRTFSNGIAGESLPITRENPNEPLS